MHVFQLTMMQATSKHSSKNIFESDFASANHCPQANSSLLHFHAVHKLLND